MIKSFKHMSSFAFSSFKKVASCKWFVLGKDVI